MEYRNASREDVPKILFFIQEIARYEKMMDEVVATEAMLEENLFNQQRAEVIFAMEGDVEVGFALFFHNFSTFVGRAGMYLEDIYVLPEYRGQGYGKGLLQLVAQLAVERGCGRMEWTCLNWNQSSIDFYLSLGAEPMDEWTVYRLAGETLKQVAADSSGTKG
ncbi:GNAT family N-acetyltransferase [Suicoccus acidiformans]|uniref:GNAT family N-acetyltransferase n=1 Tax=Suicoccus acidiformans TaxID=2036206 RepID=A0A347WM58_9LACT|nr:GNAT family N-acetyltransferase [Suicoccus acidiformans]AXY26165.1 GNAT family N-acetyltransferase [Suicoccus acidiformans]